MKHVHTQRGVVGMPVVFIVLGLILLGGIGYAVMKDPMGSEMEKKDVMVDEKMMMEEKAMAEKKAMEEKAMMEKDSMMKNDETMMKKDLPAQAGDTMMEKSTDGAMMKKDEGMMGEVMWKGTVLAGKSSPLLDFNKADYDAAVKSGKLVTLFFYANWCPLCKAEFPKMIEAFNGYTGSDVVGFRVNYKDDQTDADEKVLASQFGVAYQHTKVFVKGGKQVLKAPDTWDIGRYTSEITKYR